MKLPDNLADQAADKLMDPRFSSAGRYGLYLLLVLLLLEILVGWYWSREPDVPVRPIPAQSSVPGEVTTSALISVASTLLEKPGGYLSNDMLPHRLWLDNMPNWEYGVLVQVRDMSRVLRRDLSRSQSQSQGDPDLEKAEPRFNFDNASWAMPATESEYASAIESLENYLLRLKDDDGSARFFARADNLNYWLGEVQNRMGSLSLQLSQSVGRDEIEEGPKEGEQVADRGRVKTPWIKVDNHFYEARGACWALLHLMRAAETDFSDVLQKKNALVSYRQIIRELEATQDTIWSPMILNGSGFGMLPNHSLVMANYISRANAAVQDLRQLLSQG